MNLGELRIRAMDGSILADGSLAFEGPSSVLALLAQPKLAAVGVVFGPRLGRSWEFLGLERVVRGCDGLYAASASSIVVQFGSTIPTLGSVVSQRRSGLTIVGRGLDLGHFHASLANPEPDKSTVAFGSFDELTVDFDPSEAGLKIDFAARVSSMSSIPDNVCIEGTTIRGQVAIKREAILATGQSNAQLPGTDRDSVVTGPWQAGGSTLTDLAFDCWGGLLAQGHVDWQQDATSYHPPGPFVDVFFHQEGISLRPLIGIAQLETGFCQGQQSVGGGPMLSLPIRIPDLARILDQSDKAEVNWQGPGIGSIDGLTGRGAYEDGSRTQDLRSLTLLLTCSPSGLHVEGSGELLPLPTGTRAENLGPKLHFAFFLPRTLILARGIDLPRFREYRRQELPAADAW